MAVFVSHITLTQQGIQEIKGLPGRIEENRKLWEESGGKLLALYVVLGDYDYLAITDAPNEKVMAEIAIKASRRGRTQFRTFAAIPVEEFNDVAQRL